MEPEFNIPKQVNISPVSGETPKKPGPINNLPVEVIAQAFTNLSEMELENASHVNTVFRDAAVLVVYKEFVPIKDLVDQIINHLDDNKYAKEKVVLQEAFKGTQVLGSVSLNQAKKSVDHLKENILVPQRYHIVV